MRMTQHLAKLYHAPLAWLYLTLLAASDNKLQTVTYNLMKLGLAPPFLRNVKTLPCWLSPDNPLVKYSTSLTWSCIPEQEAAIDIPEIDRLQVSYIIIIILSVLHVYMYVLLCMELVWLLSSTWEPQAQNHTGKTNWQAPSQIWAKHQACCIG